MKTSVSLHMKQQHLTVTASNQRLDYEGAEAYPVIKLIQADGDVTIFPSYEQVKQMYETLGAFLMNNPDKFVNKSITELEEVEND
jgi:hypothetical protein